MQGELLADRYGLMEPLGSGGMGEVWEAWDTALERVVAVKLLAAAAADAAAFQRFTDEARAVARLNDPGIAVLYDFGHAADGRPFLVMELVRGRSLAQLLPERGPLAWDAVADLGGQAARALAAAHAGGIVHRDVKPGNLLVTEDGTVKLVDFGIASITVGTTVVQADAHTVLTTAAYTAPELALGHPTGSAADLYALGCVLYEALAGHPPFLADTAAELLDRHVHEQPAALSRIRPDVPPELERIVHGLLAKNPADRPAGATDTAARLQALSARPRTPADEATALIPPLNATQQLPRIDAGTEPDQPPAPHRRPASRDRRLLLAIGGLTVVIAAAVIAFSLSGGTDEGTTASSPGDSATEDTSTPSASPSRTPATSTSPTAGPSPGPSPEQAADQSPDAILSLLSGALTAQSEPMQPDLARDVSHDLAEINKKLQEGDADKAADKAEDLRKRLTEAREKGKWSGDATVMALVEQLATSG